MFREKTGGRGQTKMPKNKRYIRWLCSPKKPSKVKSPKLFLLGKHNHFTVLYILCLFPLLVGGGGGMGGVIFSAYGIEAY